MKLNLSGKKIDLKKAKNFHISEGVRPWLLSKN